VIRFSTARILLKQILENLYLCQFAAGKSLRHQVSNGCGWGFSVVCSRAAAKTRCIDLMQREALRLLTAPGLPPATPSHGLLVADKFEPVAHLDRAPPVPGSQGTGLDGQYHLV
jgi:hypothetical protein